MTRTAKKETALDVLEREDVELRALFRQVSALRGGSVEERAECGDLAKSAIHRIATREAALVDIAAVVAKVPELTPLLHRFDENTSVRREAINATEKMSRGIQGINLNQGQAFDAEFTALMGIVGSEIEWDLDEGLPMVRDVLIRQEKLGELTSADKVVKRAPTNINPDGSRWYERAPVISSLMTVYDHLRDFPRARQRH